MTKYFLFFDDTIKNIVKNPLVHVSFFNGILKLSQFWKYYLHHTMGRPIIVRWRK